MDVRLHALEVVEKAVRMGAPLDVRDVVPNVTQDVQMRAMAAKAHALPYVLQDAVQIASLYAVEIVVPHVKQCAEDVLMNAPKTVEAVHMNAPTIALMDVYHHALVNALKHARDHVLINVMALVRVC